MIGMDFEMMQMLLGPIFHGAPHSCLMNGLFMGNTIIMPHNLCPDSIIKLIKEFGVEYMQMVPTLMHRIVKEPGVSAGGFQPHRRRLLRVAQARVVQAHTARAGL